MTCFWINYNSSSEI